MVVNALTQATIIYGTFQDLRGQRAGIGDCITRGLVSIVPVIIGSILLSLGVSVGLMLIVVPGLILLVMWWVYIPAIVVESKGIIEAFGRSRELTRGRRWHLLGLILIVGIVVLIVSFVIGKAAAGCDRPSEHCRYHHPVCRVIRPDGIQLRAGRGGLLLPARRKGRHGRERDRQHLRLGRRRSSSIRRMEGRGMAMDIATPFPSRHPFVQFVSLTSRGEIP